MADSKRITNEILGVKELINFSSFLISIRIMSLRWRSRKCSWLLLVTSVISLKARAAHNLFSLETNHSPPTIPLLVHLRVANVKVLRYFWISNLISFSSPVPFQSSTAAGCRWSNDYWQRQSPVTRLTDWAEENGTGFAATVSVW